MKTQNQTGGNTLARKLVSLALGVLAIVLGNQICFADGKATPWQTLPSDMELPTNAVVYPSPGSLPFPGVGEPPEPIEPSVSFIGLNDDNTRIPPDTMGAVGPNHIVTMLNTQVRISDRAGTNIYSTVSLSNFWGSVGGLNFAFDPRIAYDPYNQRWIATAVADPPPNYANTASLLIGVSQTSNPTNAWHRFKIDVDANNQVWADYPSLGFNQNWVVVQINMFSNTVQSGFSHARVYVFNRTNLYAGGTNYSSHSLTNLGGTIVPATTYDTNQATLYFLQTWNSTFVSGGQTNGYLRLYTLTGTATSPTFNTTSIFPQTAPWASSPGDVDFAPQTNTTVRIRTGDSRIQNVAYRNGSLWTAQTVFLPVVSPSRSAVQWWQISTNGNVQQAGRIDDSAGVNFYAFPSIGVNRFNDAVVGFSSFSTNQYASANYALRAFNDSANTMRAVTLVKAGEGRYYKTFNSGKNRWGDYSATWPDPVNDTDFWTIQEYAAAPVNTGLTDGDGRWAVQWGSVSLPVPSNDNFANSILLSGSQGSTNGTNIRGTKETGEPNHASNAGGASIWYHWTAPASGSVTIETIGSTFDTVLAVYTGSSVSGLTSVVSDHGSAGGGASRVVFTAINGTTYRVAVDGFNGAVGNVTLNWIQPSAPIFTTQPQSQTVYQGNNVTFTANAIGTPDPTYQWRSNSVNISGATSSSYSITGVQTNHAANYTVVASNSSGSATSVVAVLTVLTSEATLSAPLVTNNTFQLSVTQVSGLGYIIQANTNLSTTNWITLTTNTAPFTFTDAAFTNNPQRFYRAIYKP